MRDCHLGVVGSVFETKFCEQWVSLSQWHSGHINGCRNPKLYYFNRNLCKKILSIKAQESQKAFPVWFNTSSCRSKSKKGSFIISTVLITSVEAERLNAELVFSNDLVSFFCELVLN